MKLKPNTSYRFSESDLKFVCELAKVGHVHILSEQVSLMSQSVSGDTSLSFKDYGTGDRECLGLSLPDNWVIEWIGASDKFLKVTFGVKAS